MNLIIVESPTKARTLTRFLGSDYMVEATMGHVMDLPKSELGVDIENNFKPEYIPIEGKKKNIDNLAKASKKASKIYLATDPDREGEAIAYHVKEIIGNGKSSRITFHEITQNAVEEAIKIPGKINENLVDAQIGRRVLDRLVGYKLSPLLWKKVRRGLSAGRVQSVAVRLIVEREREIEAFKKEEYWEIYVTVSQLISLPAGKVGKPVNQFIVQLIKIGDKKAEIHDKNTAETVTSELKRAKYSVFEVKKREVKKNPYPPFTTSTMTQAGARIFGWSAKRTMFLAQRLYEKGFITYHRTDSTNIAQVAIEKTREFIKKSYGDKYLPETPRIYKTKSKVAQEAHETVRPTDVSLQPSAFSLQPDFKRLYDLIWKRFVACQMTPSVYDETTIDVSADSYLLRTSGQVMKFDGWRKVISLSTSSSQELIQLPEVAKDDPLQLVKVTSEQKFTEPPPRYNEASLIKTLEKLGIGRPSTYAPTISTIQVRSYVEKDEGKFIPTNVGTAVNDFLLANFPDVFDYKFTAEMEDNLDKIADGKLVWTDTMRDFWKPFNQKLSFVEKNSKRVKIEVEKLGKPCPECKQGELVVRIGRFGKFISCLRFPDCKYTEKYLEKVGMKCPTCGQGEVIVKKTKKGRKFYGCSRYPDCKWASWQKPK